MPYINPKNSTCYIANVGSGKTMIITYEHALQALQAGVKVVSDYYLNWNGDNLTYFRPDEFEEVCMTWRNCIVFIDEIGVILDSRQWADEGSNTRQFFQYHRKHHVEIVSSTQHLSQVAKSSKNMVNKWVICSQIYENPVPKAILKLFGFEGVVIKTEVVQLVELANEKNIIDPEAPLIWGDKERGKTYWLSQRKLVRPDLDDMKDELEHLGCLNCHTRFTDKDLADTLNNRRCPLCMTESLGKLQSIMYDTDYELPKRVLDGQRTFVESRTCPECHNSKMIIGKKYTLKQLNESFTSFNIEEPPHSCEEIKATANMF